MKHLLILFTCFVLVFSNIKTTRAQTTLSAGDIVIVAINGDADATYGRGFSFMPLINLEAGTEIYFTDYGWSDIAGAFINSTAASDVFVKYTAPAGGVTAGTVIRNATNSTTNFAFYFAYGVSSYDYVNIVGVIASDEVLAFQGSIASPTFIFAASYVSTDVVASGWATNVAATGGTNGVGSALPGTGNASVTDLVDDITAFSFNRAASGNDNCAYTGPTTATDKAGWQARISNYSNWTFNEAIPIPTPPSGPFTVVEPVTPPTVTTTAASTIASTSAILGGNVTADGGATVDARGIVYSTTDDTPTIAEGATQVSIGSGTGEFSQSVGTLSPNTTYYFSAYAHNSEGYSYGTATSFTTTPEATMPSGSGDSEADPYLISNLAELYWIAEQISLHVENGEYFVGKYFKQTANIDASSTTTWFGGAGWLPIGFFDEETNNYEDFGGIYDGQGFTISNIYINRPTESSIGLFGSVTNGVVKNLGATNLSIQSNSNTGGLVGYLYGTNTIENCYTTGTITSTGSIVAGLIGTNDGSNTINQCYSECNVTGLNYVAGIYGQCTTDGAITTNCHSSGTITSTGENALTGGLIAYAYGNISNCYSSANVISTNGYSAGFIHTNYATVSNCYATGNVTGKTYCGGFVGSNGDGRSIDNCYSTGSVIANNPSGMSIGGFAGSNVGTITRSYTVSSITSSASNTGGFVGNNFTAGATVSNDCFWNTDVYTTGSGINTGNFSASGKTTPEMKTSSTFTDAGWDFIGETTNGTNDYWGMDGSVNNGYPIFVSQLPGTFNGVVNNDWATADNWSDGNIPTSTTDVTIPSGKTAVITAGTSADCNNISIDAAGSLTIQSTSATNAGSLIVVGTATGNVTFESYLAETGKWHVVAAPVASQNIWDFATLAGNSIAEKTGKRAVTEYNESTNTWDTNYPTADTEGSFSAGSGYSMLRSEAGVVSYTGSINTSDVSKLLTRNLYGWNALGNPYTSAINATVSADATNNLITANTDNFDPSFAALYVWDAATNGYVTINNTGTGSLVQSHIQAGQGFFVRAKDNSGLTFSITEAMQTHQPSVPLKSGVTAWPTIQLAASGNEKLSKTIVTFNRNMTTGLDVTYDAGMFKADKNFALYSKLVDDNGVDFAIQALPDNRLNELVIPLGIDAPAGTEITFSAQAINLPADAAVYLQDRAAKTMTQLDVAGAKYTVTITEETKGSGNFFLHTSSATTAVSELKNNLQVYTRDRTVYIKGNINLNDVVAVYGVDGKLHYRKNAEKTGLLRIDAAQMPAGVYLISIEQKTGRVTRKVVISE